MGMVTRRMAILTPPTEGFPGIEEKNLGSISSKNNNFSSQQIFLLQSLAVAASIISLAAGLIAFYWFVRMRRSYRHHLIMLLIMSDMFKSLWYLIFPAVNFVYGGIPNSSPFCQVSGFFLTLGVEASDIAILMIALHSALCIFRSGPAHGEAGLYRYRYIAYAVWLGWPSIAASLAFLNQGDPYISGGPSCSLPVRPFWFRLALSWVPRYIILLSISGIYLSIYLYVRQKFNQFKVTAYPDAYVMVDLSGRSISAARQSPFDGAGNSPSFPHLSLHGLITSLDLEESPTQSGPSWENYMFGGDVPLPPPSDPVMTPRLDSLNSPSEDTVSALTPQDAIRRESVVSAMSTNTSNSRTNYNISQALRDSRVDSLAPTTQSLRRTMDGTGSGPLAACAANELDTHHVVSDTLQRRHKAVRRQLRLLSIYPFVYMIMWIVPFVSHCLSYNDSYAMAPSFIMVVITTVSLSIQCAADCLVFSIREKPWRRLQESDRIFWRRFKIWSSGSGGTRTGVTNSSISTFDRNALRGVGSGGLVANTGQQGARHRGLALASHGGSGTTASVPKRRMKGSSQESGKADKSWWEFEGRQRNDSVMLGTDNSTEPAPPVNTQSRLTEGRRGSLAADAIMEEGILETEK